MKHVRCHFTDEGTLEQCSRALDHNGEHVFPWQQPENVLKEAANLVIEMDVPVPDTMARIKTFCETSSLHKKAFEESELVWARTSILNLNRTRQ